MIYIGIDKVDGKLRARHLIQPDDEPHYIFDISGREVAVWLLIADEVDEDELEDLVWITVATIGAKW